MNVTELKAVLERLEALYAAGGATAAAKDLRSIGGLLDGHEAKSVDTFITETREILEQPKTPAAKPNLDAGRINAHSDRLLAAGLDQKIFDAALSDLDNEKKAGKAEWAAIANRFRNAPTSGTHEFKFKNIHDARKAIRDTFIERHEAASKRSVIERLTKWAS